jgi:hypothetical protein
MSEEKTNLDELTRKIDELLNVLKVISGDLTEVSKSLKEIKEPAVASTISVTQASEKKQGTKAVKEEFSPELEGMLTFEDKGNYIIVRPRRFLGSDNFAKIASVVRNLGGEYISAGKNSHFKVPKETS